MLLFNQSDFMAVIGTTTAAQLNWYTSLPSSVPDQSKYSPVGTEISFKFDYYHPPTPTLPPGKVEMQLEIDKIWSVGNWWIVCLVIFGGRG